MFLKPFRAEKNEEFVVCTREREREREREGGGERETDRQTDRDRHRERERERLTDLQQNKGVDMVVSDTDELSPRSVSAARSLGVRRAQ